MSNKMPSPWSEEFYTGNTTARVVSDEIQHIGNKNSGRYKRGSGKNPRRVEEGGLGIMALAKQAKIDRAGRDSSTDAPYVQSGSGRIIYPKSWSKEQVAKHKAGMENAARPGPDSHLTPATKAQISSAEKQLGVTFSPEYKSLMEKHGSFTKGSHEILGVDPAHPRLDTVKVTKEERERNPKIALKDAYVVEDAGIEGIMIWQKKDGTVHQTCPDGTYPNMKVADSLSSWVNT